ncbi:MAG: hypothetical protein AAF899_04350 [Pseudomonadota bacterium]
MADGRWINGREGIGSSGDCMGKAAMPGYPTTLASAGEMIADVLYVVFGSGERVVVVRRCSLRNRAAGRVFHSPKVDMLRISGVRITAGRKF